MKVSVACLTENQGFTASGGHRLDPPRSLAAFVFVEVFERTDMMDLDLVSHMGCSTCLTDLGQESFFQFRSAVPMPMDSLIDACLDIPFQRNASPGRDQRFFSLAWRRSLEHFVGSTVHDYLPLVCVVDGLNGYPVLCR